MLVNHTHLIKEGQVTNTLEVPHQPDLEGQITFTLQLPQPPGYGGTSYIYPPATTHMVTEGQITFNLQISHPVFVKPRIL